VGCGGVVNGRDVYEHILCGAKAVQVGSQFKREGIEVFDRLSKELMEIIGNKGYSCIEDFRGKLNYL
jgi:dihydroorotate dehydrogenase (fumarate)